MKKSPSYRRTLCDLNYTDWFWITKGKQCLKKRSEEIRVRCSDLKSLLIPFVMFCFVFLREFACYAQSFSTFQSNCRFEHCHLKLYSIIFACNLFNVFSYRNFFWIFFVKVFFSFSPLLRLSSNFSPTTPPISVTWLIQHVKKYINILLNCYLVCCFLYCDIWPFSSLDCRHQPNTQNKICQILPND